MHPLERISEDLHKPVADFMYTSALKHANTSNGLLVALEPDTDRYDHQSLLHPIVRSKHLADTVDLTPIANAISPNYPKVIDAITNIDADLAQDERALTLVGEVIESGQNVVFGYDHGEDVITFIMNATASTNVLREREYVFRPAVMASKMIDYLAIDLTSFGVFKDYATSALEKAEVQIEPTGLVFARNLLSKVFSVQYLTIPNSQTTDEFRKRNQLVVETYNKYVRKQISDDTIPSRFTKRKPPLLIHAATPGSLNYQLDVKKFHQLVRRGLYDFETTRDLGDFQEGRVEVVGGASEGLISIFGRALTYAVAAKMSNDRPFFAIDKAHIALTDSDAIKELGRKQISLLDQAEPDMIHIYDAKKNLPLVR